MNLKMFVLKIVIVKMACYYYDDIIKLDDFDHDNFLINKKSRKNTLIYNI